MRYSRLTPWAVQAILDCLSCCLQVWPEDSILRPTAFLHLHSGSTCGLRLFDTILLEVNRKPTCLQTSVSSEHQGM